MSTCALVPVNPKELTPARRGLPLACHGIALVHDPHRQGVPRDMRRRILEVQVLRQHFVLQRQHDLDQTGDARRRLEMPDVGLHRSHQQRPIRVTADAVDGRCRLHLDRITQRRCRSRAPRGNRRRDRRDRHEPALR